MKKLPLRDIFGAFLHLGVTAFGGLAMIEPLRRRVVAEQAWVSQEEFLEGLALCQMVPGATVVQLATYVGYRLRGVPGALAAAGGFILPAFFLMWGLAFLYFNYGQLQWVKAVSRGLNAVVIALLFQALWGLGQALGRGVSACLIALAALVGLWAGVNYLLVFVLAGILSLALELRGASARPGPPGELSTSPRPHTGRVLIQVCIILAGLALLVVGLGHWDLILGRMAWIFLKIGALSFGGGYVMIPILQWEVVDHYGWLTVRQFLDGILLSYITPGPLIILAAFVGYGLRGVVGGVVATVSVFLPPILMIIYLFPYYQRLKEAWWMPPVLRGILAALVGMLALVTAQMGLTALTGLKELALLAAATLALLAFKINLFYLVVATALLSLWFFGGGG